MAYAGSDTPTGSSTSLEGSDDNTDRTARSAIVADRGLLPEPTVERRQERRERRNRQQHGYGRGVGVAASGPQRHNILTAPFLVATTRDRSSYYYGATARRLPSSSESDSEFSS